jgi:translation elongation factor EF-1alpha
MNIMVTKSLSVLGNDGAGKKALIGSLIYKCGLELPQLEQLESEGISQYEKIVPFFEKNGRAQSFYAPSGTFTVQKSQAPDVAFWVVDASDSSSWGPSAEKLSVTLSSSMVNPREKLMIVVNKMDSVNWSEQTFKEVVGAFSSVNMNNRAYIIPVSALREGGNILPTPKAPSWVQNLSTDQFGGSASVSGESLMNLLG